MLKYALTFHLLLLLLLSREDSIVCIFLATFLMLSISTREESTSILFSDLFKMHYSHSPSNPVISGTGEWTSQGPWGGKINVLETAWANDSVVLAGCGYQYAPETGGVYKSVDGGITWYETELSPVEVTDICSGGPQAPNSFYAATRTGLYLSNNLGETWSILPGLDSSYVISIGASYGNPDVLIAGLGNLEGVRRTADGGITWSEVGLYNFSMNGFGCDPIHPDTMYITASNIGGGYALCRSTDEGVSWERFGPLADSSNLLVAPFGTGETILVTTYDGYYMTQNYGDDWELVVQGQSYAPAACDGVNLYAPVISKGGVYESSDSGQTWALNTQGINASSSYWKAGVTTSAGYLAGHEGGIYRSVSPDQEYTVSQTGISNGYFYCLSYTSSTNTLLAGGYMHGLWKSTDMGASWDIVLPGPENWSICDIAPESDLNYIGSVRYCATYGGLFKSEDAGETWENLGLDNIGFSSITFDPSNPDNVWAGSFADGVFYSSDGGYSWAYGTGLPDASFPAIELIEKPNGDLRILVSYQNEGDGVYYSDDAGASYTEVSVPGAIHPDLSVNNETPIGPVVYLATDVGVWRSSDYGESWLNCSGPSGFFWEVLGTFGMNLFSGDGNGGVLWSSDMGGSWHSLSTGVESKELWDIVYGASYNQLFASFKGFGVYELTDSQLSIEESQGEEFLSIHPSCNPVTSSVHFTFTGLDDSPADLSIYSTDGRMILESEVFEDGLQWSPDEGTPAGVYLVKLLSLGRIATNKIVLLR